MKNPIALSFILNIMDNIFVNLNLQSFETRTVHELLWGYEDAKLSQALKILTAVAKFRDPTFNIEIPKTFALQVCPPFC